MRFVEKDIVKKLGLHADLKKDAKDLGMGTMATKSYDLYPDLVRQFMTTVQIIYINERVKRQNKGTFTFFIRDIRYMILIIELRNIYGLHNPEHYRCTIPPFPG